MKAPLGWIKDYVDVDVDAEELKAKLFASGFEVEGVEYPGGDIRNIVVGKILSIEKHPNADKLVVCQIDVGSRGGVIQIVTGAKNVSAGDLVPVCLDGAVLANGTEIRTGTLRGVLSQGMLCSGEEIGIGDDWYEGAETDGILLFREEHPLGEDVRIALGLDEPIFDIAVTANRPDCQSIYGIAREVAAVLKKPLRPLKTDFRAERGLSTKKRIGVRVEAPDLCPRYTAHYVSDVKIAPSPAWMRRRLASVGLRSINNVVDITNFVLMEVGQPMHAFDLARLDGAEVVVRRAKKGETIVTLDGKKFDLTPENLVICDGEKPAALAGIMGGKESGIAEETKEILFESAKFARDNVRRTSRALGQRSDSSSRFEKGIDAYTNEVALNRALNLIEALGCGKIACDRYDLNSESTEPAIIRTSVDKINALLGIEVPAAEIVADLERLQFEVTLRDGELEVKVPPFREDVDGYPDLAEEVIRSYGYEHVRPTLLASAAITNGGRTPAQRDEDKLCDALCALGYSEIINYSFVSEKDYELFGLDPEAKENRHVRLVNPLGEDMAIMRTFLAPSMAAVLARNLNRKVPSCAFFEFARVFRPKDGTGEELPDEPKMLCLGSYGEDGGFFDMKAAIEGIAEAFCLKFDYKAGGPDYLHPGRSAVVYSDGTAIGAFGELHPLVAEKYGIEKRVAIGEFDYSLLARSFGGKFVYRPIPKFPSVERDLALVVDEGVECGALLRAIESGEVKNLVGVRLFDVYTGDKVAAGKKSLAFSLTFNAQDRTLGVEEVDSEISALLTRLNVEVGAELR